MWVVQTARLVCLAFRLACRIPVCGGGADSVFRLSGLPSVCPVSVCMWYVQFSILACLAFPAGLQYRSVCVGGAVPALLRSHCRRGALQSAPIGG